MLAEEYQTVQPVAELGATKGTMVMKNDQLNKMGPGITP